MVNKIQEDSKDQGMVEPPIIHHSVRDRRSFIDSWEFVMLVILASVIFGFLLGLGLRLILQ